MISEKQRRFCIEYTRTGMLEESAIAAGYSVKGAKNSATRNLRNKKCQEYMKEIQKEVADEKIATVKEVLETLTAIMRGEVKETDTFFIDGKIVEKEKPCKVSERLKAADLLGKRYGIYTEKIELKEEHKTIEVNLVE